MKTTDRIDHEILRLLRKNARMSNKEIAGRVGLAPSSCFTRVRALQASGAIHGYHADIDPAAMGAGLQAMINVRLKHHSKPIVDGFRSHTLELPEVMHIYHVAGATDFLVHVWARDSEHLRDLALTAFATRDEVSRIETGLIFEHTRSLNLPEFEEE